MGPRSVPRQDTRPQRVTVAVTRCEPPARHGPPMPTGSAIAAATCSAVSATAYAPLIRRSSSAAADEDLPTDEHDRQGARGRTLRDPDGDLCRAGSANRRLLPVTTTSAPRSRSSSPPRRARSRRRTCGARRGRRGMAKAPAAPAPGPIESARLAGEQVAGRRQSTSDDLGPPTQVALRRSWAVCGSAPSKAKVALAPLQAEERLSTSVAITRSTPAKRSRVAANLARRHRRALRGLRHLRARARGSPAPSAASRLAPASLVPLPPSPTTIRVAPAASAASMSCPTPKVDVSRGPVRRPLSRCSPQACAASTYAVRAPSSSRTSRSRAPRDQRVRDRHDDQVATLGIVEDIGETGPAVAEGRRSMVVRCGPMPAFGDGSRRLLGREGPGEAVRGDEDRARGQSCTVAPSARVSPCVRQPGWYAVHSPDATRG